MELENLTELPAFLMRGALDERTLFGSLVVRATFDLEDGRAKLAEEQVWGVSPGPWDGPQGKMPGDELFYRGGVDVFLFGKARAAKGKAPKSGKVGVAIGSGFSHEIVVSGPRVWRKGEGGLVASEAEAFTEIPLTLAEAYGGADEWDELPIPFPANPGGKGYYITEKGAEGKPLPLIEDPGKRVARWTDQPEPVGVGVPPFPFGPHLERTVEFDGEGQMTRLDPKFFNQAFPGMIAEKPVEAGAKVVVAGMREEGDLAFHLPDLDLEVEISLGEKRIVSAMPIDQVGIEVDESRLFVTYRYPFRYVMHPEEKRSCRLSLKSRIRPE